MVDLDAFAAWAQAMGYVPHDPALLTPPVITYARRYHCEDCDVYGSTPGGETRICWCCGSTNVRTR